MRREICRVTKEEGVELPPTDLVEKDIPAVEMHDSILQGALPSVLCASHLLYVGPNCQSRVVPKRSSHLEIEEATYLVELSKHEMLCGGLLLALLQVVQVIVIVIILIQRWFLVISYYCNRCWFWRSHCCYRCWCSQLYFNNNK